MRFKNKNRNFIFFYPNLKNFQVLIEIFSRIKNHKVKGRKIKEEVEKTDFLDIERILGGFVEWVLGKSQRGKYHDKKNCRSNYHLRRISS